MPLRYDPTAPKNMRGAVLVVAGLAVLCLAITLWGVNRRRGPTIAEEFYAAPGLPAVLPREYAAETKEDYERLIALIPEERRESFRSADMKRQRLMVKSVFGSAEYMRTGRVSPARRACWAPSGSGAPSAALRPSASHRRR